MGNFSSSQTTPEMPNERHHHVSVQDLQLEVRREAARKEASRQEILRQHQASLNAMMSRLNLSTAQESNAPPVRSRTVSHPSADQNRLDSILRTSEVTVVSHAHGRQRREERDIEKRELQEAIKYGRRERANPGRDGSRRWRFTRESSTSQMKPCDMKSHLGG
jgi:hypothetical protein